MGRGASGISYGKLSVMSDAESLEKCKAILFEVLDKVGYPEREEAEGPEEDDASSSSDEDEESLDDGSDDKEPWMPSSRNGS